MTEKKSVKNAREGNAYDWLYNTAEWLITAFAYTIVFIVFIMQAYTIPTGSMADTLKGAHFRLRCGQCGYGYDYDFIPERYKMARNTTPGVNVPIGPAPPRCPSCGYYMQSGQRGSVIKGDRIFVLKCIYQFFKPMRWDVVVFKNPLYPQENYIKRLVARPGETVELIDGDVYIDGRIARKPPRVQEELWMCIYDNDYRPVTPELERFNGHAWMQPFRNTQGSGWNLELAGGVVFGVDSEPGRINTIEYDTSAGNDFKAAYAYDTPLYYPAMPICSDIMVRFDVVSSGSWEGTIGASLSKYGIEYSGRIEPSGRMVISKGGQDTAQELAAADSNLGQQRGHAGFRFANVDHKLILEFGDVRVEYDLGTGAGDAGTVENVTPQVKIFGSGKKQLSHIGIFRDIHYISVSTAGLPVLQAGQGHPFRLGENEFFVLGDNSPASADGRCWNAPGVGNDGERYTQGTVPRDYLVGKAFFIYWPGPFKPFNGSRLADYLESRPALRILKMLLNVPYVDGMKFIYGGDSD